MLFCQAMVSTSRCRLLCLLSTCQLCNLKCKFKGVLVACEDEPRETQMTQESPRKRKALSENNQAVDCMLVDKTGAVKATVWGTLATELCGIWRVMAEARMRGEPVGQIVEFSKMRVAKLAKKIVEWGGLNAHI